MIKSFFIIMLLPLFTFAKQSPRVSYACEKVLNLRKVESQQMSQSQIEKVLNKIENKNLGNLSSGNFAKELLRVSSLRNMDVGFLLAYAETESAFRSNAVSKNIRFYSKKFKRINTTCIGLFQLCISDKDKDKANDFNDPIKNLELAGEILSSENIEDSMWEKNVFLNTFNPAFCRAFNKNYTRLKRNLATESKTNIDVKKFTQ